MDTELSTAAGPVRRDPRTPPPVPRPARWRVAKLVGRVEWVAGNAASTGDQAGSLRTVRAIIGAVGETLQLSASLICDGQAHPVDDPALVRSLQESTRHLDEMITTELDAEVSTLIEPGCPTVGEAGRADAAPGRRHPRWTRASRSGPWALPPTMVADATLEAAGAPGVATALGAIDLPPSPQLWRRLLSHLSFRSVWFRNAVRGAAGLALAVAIVEVTDVEHGFWVVLGTLSVLRSNALGTGATALRAVGGTAVGFVVGSAIMIGVGGHTVLLWVLLPLAVLVSGVAPSMISFAAGQAGFTLVVIILFNIISPAGWKVGLTRIEDVAIGCGVSIVVGLLFWPRGATAALGRALSDAFVKSSGYLADAVDRLTVITGQVDTGARPTAPPMLPICGSMTRSGSSWPSGGRRWYRSTLWPSCSPGRIGSGWPRSRCPRCRHCPPSPGSPSSNRWPWPARSYATPTRPAIAGMRSSANCWRIGGTRWTRPRPTTRRCTTCSGRPSTTLAPDAGVTGSARRSRCCGPMSCSRANAWSRSIWLDLPSSSPDGRSTGRSSERLWSSNHLTASPISYNHRSHRGEKEFRVSIDVEEGEVGPTVAGLLGGIDVDGGPSDEQLTVLGSIVSSLWKSPDVGLAEVAPVGPGETAAALVRGEVRVRFWEILMALEL